MGSFDIAVANAYGVAAHNRENWSRGRNTINIRRRCSGCLRLSLHIMCRSYSGSYMDGGLEETRLAWQDTRDAYAMLSYLILDCLLCITYTYIERAHIASVCLHSIMLQHSSNRKCSLVCVALYIALCVCAPNLVLPAAASGDPVKCHVIASLHRSRSSNCSTTIQRCYIYIYIYITLQHITYTLHEAHSFNVPNALFRCCRRLPPARRFFAALP